MIVGASQRAVRDAWFVVDGEAEAFASREEARTRVSELLRGRIAGLKAAPSRDKDLAELEGDRARRIEGLLAADQIESALGVWNDLAQNHGRKPFDFMKGNYYP